ncbi:MAG TPA: hypothetical protein VL400_20315, partial [Polyangiaceae bacterium]|nr:hypothetical protein [Polyangiaceae bacterium]
FRETARGVRHARAVGIPVAITVVVTRANYRHLAEIAALAAALGADALRFATLELVGTAKVLEKSLAPHAELVLPHVARARAVAAQRRLRVASDPLTDEDDRFAGLGVTALAQPPLATLPLYGSPSPPSPPLRR